MITNQLSTPCLGLCIYIWNNSPYLLAESIIPGLSGYPQYHFHHDSMTVTPSRQKLPLASRRVVDSSGTLGVHAFVTSGVTNVQESGSIPSIPPKTQWLRCWDVDMLICSPIQSPQFFRGRLKNTAPFFNKPQLSSETWRSHFSLHHPAGLVCISPVYGLLWYEHILGFVNLSESLAHKPKKIQWMMIICPKMIEIWRYQFLPDQPTSSSDWASGPFKASFKAFLEVRIGPKHGGVRVRYAETSL